MKSARTSCDQPMTKIASGRHARTASIVSGAFTSVVPKTGAPTSSNEHCPERSGSIGPGSVTTPAISAPAWRAASRQSRPIVSKLTQTARTGADSTEAGSAAWLVVGAGGYAGDGRASMTAADDNLQK